jgi:hypothetical protein
MEAHAFGHRPRRRRPVRRQLSRHRHPAAAGTAAVIARRKSSGLCPPRVHPLGSAFSAFFTQTFARQETISEIDFHGIVE